MADPNIDPFAEIGGGVYNAATKAWLPKDHPEALALQQAGAPAPAAPGATAPTSGAPLAQQAQGAATVSATPGAAPTGPTANQGTQDVARNSYLAMATQSRVPAANDPIVRRQADAYAAQEERARRSSQADAAEALGPYATGAVRGADRMLTERAGARAGQFEADLVGREVNARRAEIMAALQGLSGFISEDQRQALQRELSRLSADLETGRLGQQDRQFSDQLGYQIGRDEADYNRDIIRLLLGGA
jgi:hypothetical protein